MKWILVPDKYPCPEHGVDLTRQVELEVTAEGTVVVGGGGGGLDGEHVREADAPLDSPEGPFLVFVTCPGRRGRDGSDAKPHEQRFDGEVRHG